MSLSGSERSVSSEQPRQSRTRRRKLFKKRDKRSRSSDRYEFSDLEDDVFVRGPRKLRREDVEGELSYDYTNPGSLKVFTAGLNRCAGLPEFRTVLVSAVATAADVINEVLQRCEILYEDGDEFFLCEVIGKMEPYNNHHQGSAHPAPMQFVEQCRRIIGPDEHVLVIQALWKPLYGYYRRFELKQVSPNDARNARRRQERRRRRRVQLWRSGDFFNHCDLDGDTESESADDHGLHEATPAKRLRCQVATQVEPGDPPTQARSRTRVFATQTETVYFASADRRSHKKYPVPLGPYLLLLKGFDTRNDLLVNDLYDTNLLGSDDRKCDIQLRCADVQPQHCILEACHSEIGDEGSTKGAKPYCMSLAPVGNAEVLLNGQLIDRKHFLSPGDVISIGAGEMCSYVFMFKDTSQVPDRSIGLTWLMFLESAQRSIDLQQLLEGSGAGGRERRQPVTAAAAAGSCVSTTVPSDSVLDTASEKGLASSNSAAREETAAQQLTQASLGSLLGLYFGEAVDLQFSAGLLVLLTVYVADLELERAAAEIQWHITDSAVTLAKKASQMQDRRDKAQCYAEMIKACALAFEIFLFFHEACGVGLTEAAVRCQQWRDFSETTMQQILDNIFSQLGEEVLAESAALYDVGLGSANAPTDTQPTMESFLTLLTQVSQAFANSEYQCVSTLRLMILKRLVFQIGKTFTQRLFGGDPAKFLKWNCAVQLRVNLDQLEEWLRQERLEQFMVALDLPNSIVDLLATPKSLLVSTPWQQIRSNHPLIPASLLHKILLEYESRTGPVKGLWKVPSEDTGEVAYDVNCAIEDHFQLAIVDCLIPVEKVRPSVQLRPLLHSSEFNQLLIHMDKNTGASNCQLQWRHVAKHIRDRLGSPSSGQSPLGQLFTTTAPRAQTAASAAAAMTETDLEDENDDSGQQALFYDSLSDDNDADGQKEPVELRLDDDENDASIQEAGAAKSLNRQPQKSQSADAALGALPAEDEDIDEDFSIGIDPFTLANTLRNEMHAHYVQSESESGGSGDDATLPRKQRQQDRPTGPLGFYGNGNGLLSDPGDESDTTIRAGAGFCEGVLDASTEALYRQHTRSFVSYDTASPPSRQPSQISLPTRKQQLSLRQGLPDEQQPPPPPPRSWSLNNRRTQIEHRPESFGASHSVAACAQAVSGSLDDEPDLFFVTLSRHQGQSFGMELIDGEKTPLHAPGVFIRSIVANTPADRCHRLCPGDRLISVNNESLANRPYAKCLQLIKSSETVLQLLVARSPPEIAIQVLATAS